MLGHNLFCFKENQGKNNSNKKITVFSTIMLAKLKDFDLQSENQGNLQEGGYFVGGDEQRHKVLHRN